MPEKPEVITVAKKLEHKLRERKIEKVSVLYPRIIEYPEVSSFIQNCQKQYIHSITTRGKWIVFTLDDFCLLVHLRMEGKFFFRHGEEFSKHEHVVFYLDNGEELRFADVRKFGRMMLVPKDKLYEMKPYTELGVEPWDSSLTVSYLKDKFSRKRLPIKTVLLDQSIIAGIGNIYANEILFLSHINPYRITCQLTEKELQQIIVNTVKVLDKAVAEGGTTIRSYTSEEGVTGLFQNSLYVHSKEKEPCQVCGSLIKKVKIGGRGTYFCETCQK